MSSDSFLDKLMRGVQECLTPQELSDKIDEVRKKGMPLRVKLGIDATGPDIHLGFAVPLRKLRDFQDEGHTAVLIVGDFTAMIGDPSGRSKTRPPLTRKQVDENMARYERQLFRILDEEKTEIRYNSEWSESLGTRGVLELLGKYTVSQILQREDFSKRLEAGNPVFLHELLYPIFQGYDSVAVKADVELGGYDQRLNLIVGRELQREFGQPAQVIMMMPLLEGLSGGEKMSKSYDNYVGIEEEPSQMYGKLMSIPDTLILQYFELAAQVSSSELSEVRKRLESGENPRDLKAEMARKVVALYHSEDAAHEAENEFRKVFAKGGVPDEMPEISVSAESKLVDVIAEGGLASSKGEAKRLIKQGGVSIDGKKVTDFDFRLSIKTSVVLRVGKRRFARLIP
ncbi:tyrosine--tRNA ligase [candidate division WOR-3 bacterium]|uniref:Tyrosine--tRNA ligase n=1 Tax=candidate division WOR-3 bacterium TaxID=2052148 RepID=A0A9D5QD00_UNCW3|nr:tyrosine--tRNA ligase [candidate division WOR-3 bacterium]MBD3363585.1 tyrosine--tRNA ligase [candidate division WOR-3 bacterium]